MTVPTIMATRILQLAGFCLVAVFASGCFRCTPAMLQYGWKIDLNAADEQTPGYEGYEKPDAVKTKNGELIFGCDLIEVPCGPFGGETRNPERTFVVRIPRIIHFKELKPMPLCRGDALYLTAGDKTSFVAPGEFVPVVATTSLDSGRQVYPAYECVLWDHRGWLWYQPPRTDDAPPLAVWATQARGYRTPAYAYPLRILYLPVALLADLTFYPVLAPHISSWFGCDKREVTQGPPADRTTP